METHCHVSNLGGFFYQWVPANISQYGVRVTFEGNKQYGPVESEVFTVDAIKSPETFITQIETALGLGLLVILIGIGLFSLAGRGKYSPTYLETHKKA